LACDKAERFEPIEDHGHCRQGQPAFAGKVRGKRLARDLHQSQAFELRRIQPKLLRHSRVKEHHASCKRLHRGNVARNSSVFLKQRNLEEIVRDRARELGAILCFGTELRDFTQYRHGVTARARDLTTGEEKQRGGHASRVGRAV
jgi:hypothetical protein